MADMNYVSPLTSDLTDYYTKSEVDELQQGDAATYATSAEIVAGDNAVKGWVVSQGFLTEHQDLTNYATISYVDDAIAAIEPSSGGMAVRVVSTLPGVGEENVLYLVFVDNEDEDNRYAEYIWVDTLNDYEMLGYGSSEGGIIPDLTDYATKQWVEAKGYLVSSDLIGYATVSDLGDFATKDYVDDELANKANSADLATVATSGRYEDLIDKPTIPSLTGYATEAYVNNAVSGITIPDVSDFIDAEQAQSIAADEVEYKMGGLSTVAVSGSYNDLSDKPVIPAAPDLTPYATKAELTAKADAASLATVATTGDYDDLTNKPTIPVLPTLATVATSGSYNDLSDKPVITAGGITSTGNGTLALLLNILSYSPRISLPSKPTTFEEWEIAFNKGYYIIPQSNITLTGTGYETGGSKGITWYSFSNNSTLDSYIPTQTSTSIINTSSFCIKINDTIAICGFNGNPGYANRALKAALQNGLLTYSNTASGLTATTIQGAIDELAAASGSSSGITVQDVIDEFNENGLTLDDGTANKVEILNSDITATYYQSETDKDIERNTDTYMIAGAESISFGKTISENGSETEAYNIDIHPDKSYESLFVDILDYKNNDTITKTIAFVEDLPSGGGGSVSWSYDSSTYTVSMTATANNN